MSDYDEGPDVLPVSAWGGTGDDPSTLIGVDRDAGEPVEGVTRLVASTKREDRHLSTIDQSSWRLGNYRRNPVILLNHQREGLPVGMGDAKIEGKDTPEARLVATVRWDTADPVGALLAGKFARGFMTAASVGFRADKVTDRSKLAEDHWAYRAPKATDSPWWPALHYERAELLEISAVTVPSNVDAGAIRSWGARQLAEIRTDAVERTDDPAEQIRRIVRELLASEGADLVLRGIAGSPEHRVALIELIHGRAAPSTPDPWAGWFHKEG